MGRLFWKLFAAFFLALISTVITVGNIVQWEIRQTQPTFSYLNKITSTQLFQSSQSSLPSLSPEAPNVLAPQELNYVDLLIHFPTSALIFCIVSCLVFSSVLAWAISHPIKLLLEHLRRAAEGDLQARVSPMIGASHDEFSDLGEAFDFMATRLNNMIKSQSNMLHHVSHELRSPLARIQMAIGLVMQNPKKMESFLQRVELEALRMEKMIAELLEIFRLESGMQKLTKVDVDINGLLRSIISDVRYEKLEANIVLKMPGKSLMFSAQMELLHRAIENVIRNAVKYGPVDGIVTVQLALNDRADTVILEVIDEGGGVAAEELEQIFKPFVRGRGTTQIEGHGIGLAMTKHIVEAHGGEVSAINLNPTGFMVKMQFPLEPSTPPLIMKLAEEIPA